MQFRRSSCMSSTFPLFILLQVSRIYSISLSIADSVLELEDWDLVSSTILLLLTLNSCYFVNGVMGSPIHIN